MCIHNHQRRIHSAHVISHGERTKAFLLFQILICLDNLTQVELAEKAGVTARTIQSYELGSRKPSNMVTIQKIADALNTTTEYLLGSSGTYVVEAHEKGGAKAAKDIEELVSEVTGMFAGGELSEDAIEGAYKALTDAYWIAKENNKKYAPKTRRKKSDQ